MDKFTQGIVCGVLMCTVVVGGFNFGQSLRDDVTDSEKEGETEIKYIKIGSPYEMICVGGYEWMSGSADTKGPLGECDEQK